MKRVLTILFCIFMFTDVVYANQYVYVGQGYIINKNNIFAIRKYGNKLEFYSQGNSISIALKYSSEIERDKAYTEIIKKLESK